MDPPDSRARVLDVSALHEDAASAAYCIKMEMDHPPDQRQQHLSLAMAYSQPPPAEHSDLETVEKLKLFLAIAPSTFASSSTDTFAHATSNGHAHSSNSEASTSSPIQPTVQEHQRFRRFLLPNGEYVSCVYWNGLYHITGTDIIRTLVFRFRAFGRRISNMKKFEEGVFSDLRNLKAGHDATLEVPKSAFLELLFKNNCIRTQKKQKVFYWYSVQHDKLFLDALERDTRREKQGLEASSVPVAEPAMSFSYDPAMPLLQHFKEGNNAAIAAAAAITASAALASSAAVTSAGGSSSSAYCGSSGKFQSHLSAGNGVEQSNIDGIPSPSDLNSPATALMNAMMTRTSQTPFEGIPYQVQHQQQQHYLYPHPEHNSWPNSASPELPPHLSSQPNNTSSHPFFITAPCTTAAPAAQTGPVAKLEDYLHQDLSPHHTYSNSHSPTGEMRFICPVYNCGHLFMDIEGLLNHIGEWNHTDIISLCCLYGKFFGGEGMSTCRHRTSA